MNDFKPKSFWERPEGTTGMIAIGLGVLATVFFVGPTLINIFGMAITMVGQAITLTVLGAVLFAIIMILSNKKFQTLISYAFKSAMRKVTGAFVEIDPIGIMKSYIEDLRKKQETMDESIAKLQGQVKVCEKAVQTNEAEYERNMSIAKVARERNNVSAVQVSGRQAIRMEKLNKETLKPLLLQMQVHLKALRKYREVTDTVIADLNNEVKSQELQRNLILESHSAMMTAKKILMGGTDQKELFDQAMEYVVNDYGMKLGEIENFIENSKGFVDGLDLQNGVYEEEALKRLQEWENKADSILLGNSKQQMLEHTTVNSTLNMGIGVPAAGQVDYSELLSRK
jgi:hypothetical protein